MSTMAESGSSTGKKRKSTSATPAKSKIPKFDVVPVKLGTKTLAGAANFKDRLTLTTIPPKDEGALFAVGDLIWAKMTGYPWWPCLVSIDPESGHYYKISGMIVLMLTRGVCFLL